MRWEDFSKEERLLLCCTRKEMRKDCRHELRDILASGVKWSHVLKNGGKQGILSLLYLHLRNEDGIEIPSWVKERLEDFYYRIVYRNMRIYSLLKLIIKGFNERNIPVILLKGVALAEKVYGNIGLRSMYDIDFLVKKEDMEKVEGLLTELHCLPDLESEEGKSYHNRYFDKERSIGIEVHWDIENTPNPFSLNIQEIWERAKKIEMKGTHAFIFSPEDLILYLCLHSAYHHKFCKNLITLKQICDISEVIKCYRERLDWSQVEALAQKYGLSKLVYSTLFIVETLLKTGIPLDRIQGLKVDSFNVEYIDLIIKERIFAHDPFPAGMINSLSSLSFSEKIASICKAIFLPPEEMAKRYYFSSSSPKVYFYYLLRIYHLLVDYSGIVMRIVTRHPRTVSQLEKEIWVNKRQSEIDQWLESVA
jgi:hypothetical protein